MWRDEQLNLQMSGRVTFKGVFFLSVISCPTSVQVLILLQSHHFVTAVYFQHIFLVKATWRLFLSCFLQGPGMRSTIVQTQPWPAVQERQQLSGSRWDKSPGRPSSLETSTTCAPVARPSHPSLCLHPRAPPAPTRPTRRHWKAEHTNTAPPSARCWSLYAARYWFCSGVSQLLSQCDASWESSTCRHPNTHGSHVRRIMIIHWNPEIRISEKGSNEEFGFVFLTGTI